MRRQLALLLAVLAGCSAPGTPTKPGPKPGVSASPSPAPTAAASPTPAPTRTPSADPAASWPSPLPLISLAPFPSPTPTPVAMAVVSTIVGQDTGQLATGQALAMPLGLVTDVAAEADGTFYYCDDNALCIRKVTPDGTSSVLAGGLPGYEAGQGLAAHFQVPKGLALDAAAHMLYVVDQGNHLVKRVDTTNGTVTTIAGSLDPGHNDGQGAAAEFDAPSCVALDGKGGLLVGMATSPMVRRIDLTPGAGYAVTTVAGTGKPGFADGPALQAQFQDVYALAVAPDGTTYIADYSGHRVRALSSGGTVSTLFGNGTAAATDVSKGSAATFRTPRGLAIDARDAAHPRLYITDDGQTQLFSTDLADPTHALRGELSGQYGAADGPASGASVANPNNLTIAGSRLYLADSLAFRVRRLGLDDHAMATVAGTGLGPTEDAPGAKARFGKLFAGCLAPDGSLVLSDLQMNVLRRVDLAGADHAVTTLAPTFRGIDNLSGSAGLTSGPDGKLYAGQWYDGTIDVLSFDGSGHPTAERFAGTGALGAKDGPLASATFGHVCGLAFDKAGGLFVTELEGNVRLIKDGQVKTLGTRDDGLYVPWGITAMPDGSVVFADVTARKVFQLTETTKPVLLAGTGAVSYEDGPALAASFVEPAGITLTRDGNLVVSEQNGQRLRLIHLADPQHLVTTLAGTGQEGFADGVGAAASFAYPQSLSTGPDGALYVVDTTTARVRRVEPH